MGAKALSASDWIDALSAKGLIFNSDAGTPRTYPSILRVEAARALRSVVQETTRTSAVLVASEFRVLLHRTSDAVRWEARRHGEVDHRADEAELSKRREKFVALLRRGGVKHSTMPPPESKTRVGQRRQEANTNSDGNAIANKGKARADKLGGSDTLKRRASAQIAEELISGILPGIA